MLIGFLLHTGTKGEKLTVAKTLSELSFPISTSRLSFCLGAAGYSLDHFKNILHMKECERTEGRLFGWEMGDKAIAFC